jgi:1-acyl-sn-glycerol-3-phosphate acyltransferase
VKEERDMTERKRPHIRPLYGFVQFVVRVLFKVLFRMRVTGLENIPKEGSVLIASNHASWFDPPSIGCIIPREITFFVKKELMPIPLVGWFIRYAGAIPVDRGGMTAGAVKDIIRVLKGGRPVLIFPEGTRTKDGNFRTPKRGAGMIAVAADVPVIPCYIEGSYHAKPFRSRITLHFLPPVHPGDIEAVDRREQYMLVSQRIMHDIIKLSESLT